MLEKVQRRLSTNFCTNPRSSVSKAAAKCPTGISRQYRLKKLLGYSREVQTNLFDFWTFFVLICLLEGLPQPWWAYQHATGTGCRWDLTRKANSASERGLLEFYHSGNRRKCTCSLEAFLNCNNFARCVDANSSGVKLIFCPEGSVSGPWAYDEDSQMLLHRRGNRYWITKHCLITHFVGRHEGTLTNLILQVLGCERGLPCSDEVRPSAGESQVGLQGQQAILGDVTLFHERWTQSCATNFFITSTWTNWLWKIWFRHYFVGFQG